MADGAKKGGVLVLVGPSGGGKTTLQEALKSLHPDRIGRAVSYTTRKARPNEVNGVDYHFTTDEAFDALIATNAFLEHTTYGFSRYGSTKRQLQELVRSGKVVVQVLDRAGCDAYRASECSTLGQLNACFVFVTAPTAALRERIASDRDDVEERMDDARRMHQYAAEHPFDLEIVNCDLKTSVDTLARYFEKRFK